MSVVSEAVLQATFCAAMVDEWILQGVTDAVVCPGSRSTPLALALAASGELDLHVRIDERGAGFFALGLARATGRPVVVLVTSGTAAAELHAAVAEADLSAVPLLIVTADRPPELQGVGAAQTISQRNLFGPMVRSFFDPGVPSSHAEGQWRQLAARTVTAAMGGAGADPGPIQLNVMFREPLVAEPLELEHRIEPTRFDASVHGGRASRFFGEALALEVPTLVVAGAGAPLGLAPLCRARGWVLMADPRSSLRPDAVVTKADAILRVPGAVRALAPERIVVAGEPWASKVLATALQGWASDGAEVLQLTTSLRTQDPSGIVALRLIGTDDQLDAALEAELDQLRPPLLDLAYLEAWQGAEAAAEAAIAEILSGELSEPGIARLLSASEVLGSVVASSSMPVRDLEWYAVADCVEVVANRGANGIDGVTSTALGHAIGTDAPTALLIGDVAFAHDLSALVDGLGAHATDRCLLIVVVDNGGGGIFSFLPQATSVEESTFEQLFGTPRHLDVVHLAQACGHQAVGITSLEQLEGELRVRSGEPGLHVLHLVVPTRVSNVELHRRLEVAVTDAVEPLLS